jgi:hypothetical protein
MLAAASGDAVGYGTSANAQDDTRILGQENLARIYAQGNQNLMGSDVSVANDLGQAAVASNRANAALVGGLFNLGSGLAGSGVGLFGAGSAPSATALGGASQYASFKTGMGL